MEPRGNNLMEEKSVIIIVIVFCVTLLEITALITGVDGQAFATAVAALVGLAGIGAGYQFHRHKTK